MSSLSSCFLSRSTVLPPSPLLASLAPTHISANLSGMHSRLPDVHLTRPCASLCLFAARRVHPRTRRAIASTPLRILNYRVCQSRSIERSAMFIHLRLCWQLSMRRLFTSSTEYVVLAPHCSSVTSPSYHCNIKKPA